MVRHISWEWTALVWVVLLIGAAVLFLFIPGAVLWWPSRAHREGRIELGAALLGGAAVAFAVLGVQVVVELRANRTLDALEAIRNQVAEQRDVRLAVSLQQDLTGADLRNQNLSYLHLPEKKLVDANLAGALLIGSNLTGADLTDSILARTIFTSATLVDAELVNADLRNANLSSADLRDADLSGADLREAILTDTNLEGAIYDLRTRWPPTFQPTTAGAVLGP
jgi:uncharacterized protein YjbI with pentapeptide repeats